MKILESEILKQKLEPAELIKLKEIFRFFGRNKHVDSIFVTGSIKTNSFDLYSDIDICIVTNSNQSIYEEFIEYSKKSNHYLTIEQGFYNWLGLTVTIAFAKSSKRIYDIGFIEKAEIAKLFFDINSIIIYDPNKTINTLLVELLKVENISDRHLPSVNIAMFIICFIKIRKYLLRSHIWAAINSLNQLRYYVMLFYRIKVAKNKNFNGRVEKGFENVISDEINSFFISTLPIYDKNDVAKKTIKLYEFIKDILFDNDVAFTSDIKSWFSSPMNFIIKDIKKSSYEATI
jgi:predicted nucleotidyltransferase